jgi:hypothetical protein
MREAGCTGTAQPGTGGQAGSCCTNGDQCPWDRANKGIPNRGIPTRPEGAAMSDMHHGRNLSRKLTSCCLTCPVQVGTKCAPG